MITLIDCDVRLMSAAGSNILYSNVIAEMNVMISRLREDLTAQSAELLSSQQRLRDSMLRVSEIESSQLPNELEHVKVVFIHRLPTIDLITPPVHVS